MWMPYLYVPADRSGIFILPSLAKDAISNYPLFLAAALFGVFQNPRRNLPPSIRRVWASSAGMLPNTIKVNGMRIHWRKYKNTRCFPNPSGRFGGSKTILRSAEVAIPMEARFTSHPVTRGRLYEKSVVRNASPPKRFGSQPKRKIMKELVDHDKNPSNIRHDQKRLIFLGISFRRKKSCITYAKFSAPHAQRRCCLYKLTIASQKLLPDTASINIG